MNKVYFVLNVFVENFNLAQVPNREPAQDVAPWLSTTTVSL